MRQNMGAGFGKCLGQGKDKNGEQQHSGLKTFPKRENIRKIFAAIIKNKMKRNQKDPLAA